MLAPPNEEVQAEFLNLNNDLNKNLKQYCSGIQSLIKNFQDEPTSMSETKKGISFLSMKNMLMVEYLTNLLYLVYLKTNGQKLAGQNCVLRLAELRCVIEKTKSIEVKMKYQIDKLLKLAVTLTSGESDPLSFRPNTDDFAKSNEDQENDDDVISKNDGEADQKSDGIYRPPKLAPVYCDIDETTKEKEMKFMEKAKRHALKSSMMNELQLQHSEAPEEIRDDYANTIEMETDETRHKQNYEEDNFVRKALTKKEIGLRKRLERGTNLNSLSSFGDARMLLDENINMEEFMSQRKEKKKAKQKETKGGKKGKKKRKIRIT